MNSIIYFLLILYTLITFLKVLSHFVMKIKNFVKYFKKIDCRQMQVILISSSSSSSFYLLNIKNVNKKIAAISSIALDYQAHKSTYDSLNNRPTICRSYDIANNIILIYFVILNAS